MKTAPVGWIKYYVAVCRNCYKIAGWRGVYIYLNTCWRMWGEP